MNWIDSSVEKMLINKNQNGQMSGPVCPNCNTSMTRQQEHIAMNELNNVLGLMSSSVIEEGDYNSNNVNINHVQIEMQQRNNEVVDF